MILSITKTSFDEDIVNTLIDADANINLYSNTHSDALMSASRLGYTNVVRTFLKEKANVTTKSTLSETALTFASFSGYTEIV